MGQEQSGKKVYTIPQNYYQTVHPNFLDYNIDQKSNLLSVFILITSQIEKWRVFVNPLLNTKYLLTPCRMLGDDNFIQQGCCTSNLSGGMTKLNVAYQPFIYSLSRQISVRKMNNNYFREQELWKLIKYITKAILQWNSIYPYQTIFSIMPQNIVLNHKGNARLVTQYSFPKPSIFHQSRIIYKSPQVKDQSQVRNLECSLNPYKNISTELYSLGMTILDCLILQKNQFPQYSNVNEKLVKMNNDEKYSVELKFIVTTLLNEQYQKRPNPQQLIKIAQNNQNKFF